MVAAFRAGRAILAALLLFALLSCEVDLAGLFDSADLDIRLESKNTFNFLSAADSGLALGGEYRFIVIADPHIERGDAHGLERLNEVIAAINAENGPPVKFSVVIGDISQSGDSREIAAFKTIAAATGIPCYPCIGNHDIYFGNWPVWKEQIGSTCYRIDHDNARLFVLDSANAYFGESQLDWLEGQLAVNPKEHTFVFTHANIFVETPLNHEQHTDVRERARFMSILRGRCDAVFMGHVHQRMASSAGGVDYITLEDFRRSRTCCLVTVQGNAAQGSAVSREFRSF